VGQGTRVTLRRIKNNTKILTEGLQIEMDMILPLDKEDYEFLKTMNEYDISIKGRFILDNKVIGYFNNGVRIVNRSN